MPARALARRGAGCPDLTHAKDLSDNSVADRELLLRPLFWLCFALCCRLKPQVSHGEVCYSLKGGGVSGGVPWSGLTPPCSSVQAVARHLLAQLAQQPGESWLRSIIAACKPQRGW